MLTPLVEVKGITKKLRKFHLGPVDLTIEKGTIVGLVGANGSGKSTLFRVMMQLQQPEQGDISFFGLDKHKNEVQWKQKVGFVGELFDAFNHLSIEELASLISEWYPTWDEKDFEQFCDKYHIDKKEKFGNCSKGTKKKVEFIFALSHDTSLLLLDEPTAGVDINSKRKMIEDLLVYMEDGERSIVLATHMVDEVNQLCDYIVLLDDGKLVETFNKDDVYENWSRLWVSKLTNYVKNHPNVIYCEDSPNQLVTDNVREVEKILEHDQITVTHSQNLNVSEVLQFLMERTGR